MKKFEFEKVRILDKTSFFIIQVEVPISLSKRTFQDQYFIVWGLLHLLHIEPVTFHALLVHVSMQFTPGWRGEIMVKCLTQGHNMGLEPTTFCLWTHNQGQMSLDHLSLSSSIHTFTALKWSFCPLWNEIVIINSLSKNKIPPSPLVSMLCSTVASCVTIVWINIEIGEQGKSPINTPEWSNTSDPDCS